MTGPSDECQLNLCVLCGAGAHVEHFRLEWFWVACDACDMQGPVKASDVDARNAWDAMKAAEPRLDLPEDCTPYFARKEKE